MATSPTALPPQLRAGDTLRLSLSAPNYLASDGWTLAFALHCRTAPTIHLRTTADGDLHRVDVDAADSLMWKPGAYDAIAYVTSLEGERYTVWHGAVEVLPDLVTHPDLADSRSHAKRMLDAINALLEGKATKDVMSATIAGQSITRLSWRELLEAKVHYEASVAAERGAGAGRQILARFSTS